MNPPPPKPTQVIDMSDLLQSNNRKTLNVVSTGLRLSHEQSQQNQEQLFSSSSMLPGDLAGGSKRQSDELDSFIQMQVFFLSKHDPNCGFVFSFCVCVLIFILFVG